jgi:amidase
MSHSTTFDATAEPIRIVEAGETFVVDTPSVLTRSAHPRTYDELVIPVVGPYYVRGVRAGQTLRVSLLDVQVAAQGAMVALPRYGAFGDLIDEPSTRVIEIRDGRCLLWPGLELDARPMVGKLGVAVPEDAPRSNTVGDHGGNMDCKMVRPGSDVLLPVLVDGGLVYLGDAHALQADGECLMTAVEVEAQVTVRCTVLDGLEVRQPVVIAADHALVVGHGTTLDAASRSALLEMHRLLRVEHSWTATDAAMFMSAAADLSVCQIVNPRASAHVAVALRHLPSFARAVSA